MWFVHRILKFVKYYPHVLPIVQCILKSGKKTITVTGWLPCHHSNVGYTLTLRTNNGSSDIQSIDDICCTNKKSQLPKNRKARSSYTVMAQKAYSEVALWTVAVMYPIWSILKMDIDAVFQSLTQDIEYVCRRNSPHAQHVYNAPEARKKIEAGLKQMGELPYNDWTGFEDRMAWQLQTRSHTAAYDKPSQHVRNLEFYQNLWTTTEEINAAQTIAEALTPTTTNIIQGSLSDEQVPKNACILVRNVEDAYRVHCHLNWGDVRILMLKLPYTQNARCELGIVNVEKLTDNIPHIFVAWAHLWGIEDWLALIATKPLKYTCVGRLDQYSAGRGQIFRDMCESSKFDTVMSTHVMARNVEMVQTNNIAQFVAQVTAKHKTVQCFAETAYNNIDTNRRQLKNPYRIRTLRNRDEAPDIKPPRIPLIEEEHSKEMLTLNKSVIPVYSFHGVFVHAAVYIASEETTAFQIRAAQTHAREVLYVVNWQQHSPFALDRKCPKKNTIHSF